MCVPREERKVGIEVERWLFAVCPGSCIRKSVYVCNVSRHVQSSIFLRFCSLNGDFHKSWNSSNPPWFVVGSFPRPLSPNTSTLNPPSATKIYNIIGRSMEQLVEKFWKKMILWRPPTVHERVDGRLIFGHVFNFFEIL